MTAAEGSSQGSRTCGWCLPILTSSWWMSWRTVGLLVWMRAMICGRVWGMVQGMAGQYEHL